MEETGGKEDTPNTGMDELLSEPMASVAIADFMVQTGLLSQFNAVDEGALGTTNEDKRDQHGKRCHTNNQDKRQLSDTTQPLWISSCK